MIKEKKKPKEYKLIVCFADFEKIREVLYTKGYEWSSAESILEDPDCIQKDMLRDGIDIVYLYIKKEWKSVEWDFEDDTRVPLVELESL